MAQYFRPISPIQWTWISLKGPDAADFIHRLTTVNVKALQPGQGAPGFFLTPQGKMRAYFHLWMMGGDELFFEFDAGASGHWREELLKVIDQFHFGEKMTLETTLPEMPNCIWIFGSPDSFSKIEPFHFQENSGLRIFNHGTQDFGKAWFTVWGNSGLENIVKGLTEISIQEVEEMRISAGRPRVDSEMTENTIPLEAGMRNAIADNKGCYPGQEVIEKIISLGAPARRLAVIEGNGPAPQIGDEVKTTGADATQGVGQEIGKITSVSQQPSGFKALAFIRKTHAKDGIEVSFGSQLTSRGKIASVSS